MGTLEHEMRQVLLTHRMASAQARCFEEMGRWGFLEQGWGFAFNSRKKAMGLCLYPWLARGRPGRIELSRHFCESNADAEILDTIRHEIAHALAGKTAGHGLLWRDWCLKVGARPKR